MTTGANTYRESDGNAVDVTLTAAIGKDAVAYVEGWLGITNQSGASGGTGSLSIDGGIYQFTVPSTLSVSKGDTVYVDTAQVTGHTPDEAGYSTSPGSGLIALFKAIEDKDASHNVRGKLLAGLFAS